MTTALQKKGERFFVEQAIRSLKADWTILAEREPPDFLIGDGGWQFGLEVIDIFIGPQTSAGSKMKKAESKMQRVLDGLRTDYEKIDPAPLRVKFVGRIEADTLAPVVQALIDLDLASKPLAFQTVIDTQLGLRVHVTKSYRAEWFSVMDRVGWVDRNPQQIIADAIEAKSTKLAEYQALAGPDIRLLLVADAIQNSGKLHLTDEAAFDLRGFKAAYLFPYPADVITLRAA
ncbi:MAG: hypothetical protein ACLPIC_09245 [Rhodoblastus sp.]|uniref:hypothetical protein n=1 Tax=Rhodoblastus sp. TaxID=1962975 RepID=UPI003F98995F